MAEQYLGCRRGGIGRAIAVHELQMRQGKDAVVVLSIPECRKLCERRPSLKDVLMSGPEGELEFAATNHPGRQDRLVRFLLDTDVLSERRKGGRCHPNVERWFGSVDDLEIPTSVVVLGELKRGIERVRPKNPAFAGELERWLTRLIAAIGRRILPVDQPIALA